MNKDDQYLFSMEDPSDMIKNEIEEEFAIKIMNLGLNYLETKYDEMMIPYSRGGEDIIIYIDKNII